MTRSPFHGDAYDVETQQLVPAMLRLYALGFFAMRGQSPRVDVSNTRIHSWLSSHRGFIAGFMPVDKCDAFLRHVANERVFVAVHDPPGILRFTNFPETRPLSVTRIGSKAMGSADEPLWSDHMDVHPHLAVGLDCFERFARAYRVLSNECCYVILVDDAYGDETSTTKRVEDMLIEFLTP